MKRLTPKMIQHLDECYTRSLNNQDSLASDFTSTLPGLVKRGLIEVNKHEQNGRIRMLVTLTSTGISSVKKQQEKKSATTPASPSVKTSSDTDQQ